MAKAEFVSRSKRSYLSGKEGLVEGIVMEGS